MNVRAATALLALLGVGITACGETLSPTEVTTEEEMVPGLIALPTFQDHVQEILIRQGCAELTCHGIGQGKLFLGEDPTFNYEQLVNVASVLEPDFLRVAPGDPDNSYMVMRFENRQSPLFPEVSDNPVSPTDLANIRRWIELGAPF